MNIRDIMTTELVTCTPNDTLMQVAQKMQSMDVGSCPVVDQNTLVGIVTDRDITVRAISKGFDPNNTFVSDIMTPNPIYGSQYMSMEDACLLMQDNQIRRLPIVDNSRLVGIVTLADLAMDLDEDEILAETLEKISLPSH
ncbi:MAG: CBS domain-containing protein [Armatimonadota bacterium]|nr:CBS domain-containing protein [bacterium]